MDIVSFQDDQQLDLLSNASQCGFNYDKCYLQFSACDAKDVHPNHRYSDASAAWILMSAIIVFFMKAGFLLIELAFAQTIREKRHVVTLWIFRYICCLMYLIALSTLFYSIMIDRDVFASAFGFFLVGFDVISKYKPPITVDSKFEKITDPILWFFKFTFASNAATILGGCLVTNMYKLRLPAAFISAFVISGVIHPFIAQLIWSDQDPTYSAYRFCAKETSNKTNTTCSMSSSFMERMYILDFAGGGAVHLVGGMAGLVLCLFAKFQKYLSNRKKDQQNDVENAGRPLIREEPDTLPRKDFWEWMYPVDGGGETTNEAALGVLILWFSWFAFNCGSTESLEWFQKSDMFSFHAVPSIIAVNMILAASAGGIVAVVIAAWAQIHSDSDSVNANEIANGILSALVAITAGCPFYDYWGACVVGVIAVIVYHFGCWLEYKLAIEDTARVVPVHGLCGLWSLLAVGVLVFGNEASCNLHITFEGLCYCYLRLPDLTYFERIGAQMIGGCLMIVITGVISCVMYGTLFFLPMKVHLTSDTKFADRYNKCMSWFFKRVFNREAINLQGSWLFTGPEEISHSTHSQLCTHNTESNDAERRISQSTIRSSRPSRDYGAVRVTMPSHPHQARTSLEEENIHTPPIHNTVYSNSNTSHKRKRAGTRDSMTTSNDGFTTALCD